jgi:hypothetical protein
MSAYRGPGPRQPGRCACGEPLSPVVIDRVSFSTCETCRETFVPFDSLVTVASSHAWQRSYLRANPPPQEAMRGPGDRARACPICLEPMQERKDYLGTRARVRGCTGHGVWFDPDQLTRVVVAREQRSALLARPTRKAAARGGHRWAAIRNASIVLGLLLICWYAWTLMLGHR